MSLGSRALGRPEAGWQGRPAGAAPFRPPSPESLAATRSVTWDGHCWARALRWRCWSSLTISYTSSPLLAARTFKVPACFCCLCSRLACESGHSSLLLWLGNSNPWLLRSEFRYLLPLGQAVGAALKWQWKHFLSFCCRSLAELHLARNHLEQLPSGLGETLPMLRVLDVAYNSLMRLPDSLGKLKHLENLNALQPGQHLPPS